MNRNHASSLHISGHVKMEAAERTVEVRSRKNVGGRSVGRWAGGVMVVVVAAYRDKRLYWMTVSLLRTAACSS